MRRIGSRASTTGSAERSAPRRGRAIWPAADLGIAAYSGDGGVKSVGINIGSWNSLHTGDTGTDGPSTKFWYESDFYAALGLGFGGGVSLATTCTAYTSPNNS